MPARSLAHSLICSFTHSLVHWVTLSLHWLARICWYLLIHRYIWSEQWFSSLVSHESHESLKLCETKQFIEELANSESIRKYLFRVWLLETKSRAECELNIKFVCDLYFRLAFNHNFLCNFSSNLEAMVNALEEELESNPIESLISLFMNSANQFAEQYMRFSSYSFSRFLSQQRNYLTLGLICYIFVICGENLFYITYCKWLFTLRWVCRSVK